LEGKKVLFCTYEFPPFSFGGGAGVYAKNLVNELDKKGVIVYVIFAFDNNSKNEIPRKIKENIYLYPLKIKKIPGLSYFIFNLKLRKIISNLKVNFNLVHFNFTPLFTIKNVPNFITVHHPYGSLKILLKFFPQLIFSPTYLLEYNPLIEYLDIRAFRRSDFIISVSKFSRNWLIQNYHISPKKIKTIYQGVKIPRYNHNKNQKYIEEYNLKGEKIILFVGRLEIRKGILDLVDALSIIPKKIEYKCIIIGKGPLKNTILRRIKEYKLSDNFIFIDYLKKADLNCFYYLCDIYVQPSYLEGFGLTLIEAMATGTPVISTNTGAIPEIIKNNYNGILVKPNDSSELGKKIIYCLENDDFRKKLGNNALESVKNRFKWAKSIVKLIKYYGKIIS
jgi:glycosyltransferase involved in cell wall biosynthesis